MNKNPRNFIKIILFFIKKKKGWRRRAAPGRRPPWSFILDLNIPVDLLFWPSGTRSWVSTGHLDFYLWNSVMKFADGINCSRKLRKVKVDAAAPPQKESSWSKFSFGACLDFQLLPPKILTPRPIFFQIFGRSRGGPRETRQAEKYFKRFNFWPGVRGGGAGFE